MLIHANISVRSVLFRPLEIANLNDSDFAVVTFSTSLPEPYLQILVPICRYFSLWLSSKYKTVTKSAKVQSTISTLEQRKTKESFSDSITGSLKVTTTQFLKELETTTKRSTALASFTAVFTSAWRFNLAAFITAKTRKKVALVAIITWNCPL